MESMHTQLIKQITDNVHSDDLFINDSGEISVKIENDIFIIPNLPEAFTSDKNAEKFRKEYLNHPSL